MTFTSNGMRPEALFEPLKPPQELTPQWWFKTFKTDAAAENGCGELNYLFIALRKTRFVSRISQLNAIGTRFKNYKLR